MYYTVYKTTNLINGKFYIGKHQTKNLNDGYMGSGKLIRRAFRKYGIENFSFEYIGIYDQEWKMNLAEKIYVVLDKEMSYNLCPGGQGGFGYINKIGLNRTVSDKGKQKLSHLMKMKNSLGMLGDSHLKAKKTANTKKITGNLKMPDWKGKLHSEETKIKMSQSQSGSNNSQFGTCWVTNEKENKKIKLEELESYISYGYRRGRKVYSEVGTASLRTWKGKVTKPSP